MDVIHLRYFQSVAQQENLTKAAELLHVSQPALSTSLSKLERELGVQLFDRVGRRIQLNQYGRIYIGYVNQMLACLDNAKRELDNYAERNRQKLTISTVSMQLLQDMLSDYTDLHEQVTVRRYEVMVKDLGSELNNGDCDFIISATHGGEEYAQSYRIIKRERLYLAVERHHPVASREIVNLSEMKDEAFISLPVGYSFRTITDRLCNKAGFECEVLHECFHCQLLNYVSDGIGVAIIPESLMNKELQRKNSDERLAFLRLSDTDAYRNIAMEWNNGRVLSRAAQELLDFGVEYYRHQRPADLCDCAREHCATGLE